MGTASACSRSVSGSGEDGRYQSKCCEISGNAAFRSHRRSGRCSSFPGLQYPVYREHDQQPWFYGRCSHVFRRCQPGSDHTGLSAVWIFRFRRCPSPGIWHSIPVRSDDAVYRDHRGTGNFHDCEDFNQQEERIFPACGKLMMKKDKTL